MLGLLIFLGWRFSASPPTAAAVAQVAPPPAAGIAPAAPTPEAAPPPIVAQQASVASIIEVVVGRNDTLDGIFRRMALNKSDLAAIRNLPGIRQSLDFLKPGDSIKLTHTDGDIKELTRKVSETQTLDVVLKDSGFEAKMIDNPVETRVRTIEIREAAGKADPVELTRTTPTLVRSSK